MIVLPGQRGFKGCLGLYTEYMYPFNVQVQQVFKLKSLRGCRSRAEHLPILGGPF